VAKVSTKAVGFPGPGGKNDRKKQKKKARPGKRPLNPSTTLPLGKETKSICIYQETPPRIRNRTTNQIGLGKMVDHPLNGGELPPLPVIRPGGGDWGGKKG